MKKNVIISMRGTQLNDEAGLDLMEMMTEGKMYRKGGIYYLTYRESETTGLEGTTTTIKIAAQEVALIRFGTVNSQFIFQLGKKHISYYETPYGAFMIGITTNSAEIEMKDDGGYFNIGYGIEINNGAISFNQIQVLVRESGKIGG